ncbi:MAG: glutamate formimidoyltransferase [Candidatus Cloacimonadota bacterium]|nr:glutamate formimidoyltransferase [Candidatus Cloacimonadota bacterium]
MNKIVECVPNFSEGRNKEIIEKISDAVRAVDGVTLLDVDPGEATNRTVFTFVGNPESIKEGAFRAIEASSKLIDMREHSGEHARMGACDVCPFVPVAGVDVDDCVQISKEVGKRVAEELNIPIFLYEHSRTKPDRQNLAVIRKGEYEGMEEKLKDPHWKPDFGEKFNVKSGVTAMGCRDFLIAYNINLNTKSKKIAHDIALDIRETGRILRGENGKPLRDENGEYKRDKGGFVGVKAVGWFIDEYDKAQISMNITNYKASPIHKIFEYVEMDAIKHGVRVTGSELVGLIPKEPVLRAGKYFLEKQHLNEQQYFSAGVGERELVKMAIDTLGLNELTPFDPKEKIIEYTLEKDNQLRNMSIVKFADELSSDSPAPGGGSVAALCGSLSAGLSSMVANLSTKKLSFRKLSETKLERRSTLISLAFQAQEIKDKLLTLIDTDTEAFEKYMDANRLPENSEEEKKMKIEAVEAATQQSTIIPLETMRESFKAIECAKIVAELGMKNALSDAGVSAVCGLTAVKSAYMNVKINLPGINDKQFKKNMLIEAEEILLAAKELATEIEESVMEQIGLD